MAKIIDLNIEKHKKEQPQPERELLRWGHCCANFLFKLREDGKIICDKCGEVVAEWYQ